MRDSGGRRFVGAQLETGVCALLLLLVAGRAGADYKDNFKKGMDAYDHKRWDEVVRQMRSAIGDHPAEGERIKLYGLRFEMYFPYFYLGAAYLNQGKCSEAVQAFKASESQGAIRNTPKYAELVDGLKSCEGVAPAPQVAQFPSTRPPTAPPSAPPATFPTNSPPPTPLPTPAPTLAPTPAPTPTPGRAPSPRPSPTFAPTPTPTPIKPLLPPTELLNGARAYFDGRYQDAVDLLSRSGGLRGRAAAQSLLLRSAARFALFKVGGEKDADLHRQATADAAASRRADATLIPDAEAFSPQFVEFFRASR